MQDDKDSRSSYLVQCEHQDSECAFPQCACIRSAVKTARPSLAEPSHAQRKVDAQAKDGGLWFDAVHLPEAYLQRSLRELHAAVEADTAALSPLAAPNSLLRDIDEMLGKIAVGHPAWPLLGRCAEALMDKQEAAPSHSAAPTNAPFSNCRFQECDLPGQCVGEGKCHHPRMVPAAIARSTPAPTYNLNGPCSSDSRDNQAETLAGVVHHDGERKERPSDGKVGGANPPTDHHSAFSSTVAPVVKRYSQVGSGMVSTFTNHPTKGRIPAGEWIEASDYDALAAQLSARREQGSDA